MTAESYVILAYVVALGFMWGAVGRLWVRRRALRARS